MSILSMNRRHLSRRHFLGTAAAGTLLMASGASADEPNIHLGRAEVYKQISPESLETVSTRAEVSALGAPNVAPTRIWKVLEHGEKLECLGCIPVVSKLLADDQRETLMAEVKADFDALRTRHAAKSTERPLV